MNIDNLYQKRHGLPGVGFSSGTNGLDGEGGNNVYFGYINDFFETIELDADNLIRIATSDDGYYTGLFIDVNDSSIKPWHWDSSLMDLSEEKRSILEQKTHFVEIMEDPEYPGRYKYTFDPSTDNMRMYVKADVSAIGKDVDGSVYPWNISEEEARDSNRWIDISVYHDPCTGLDVSTYPYNCFYDSDKQPYVDLDIEPGRFYPYVAYNGSDASIKEASTNIKPGNYQLSQSDLNGFELFSIKTASATYQFAHTGDTKYYPQQYKSFADDSSHNIDNPSISGVGLAYAYGGDASVLYIDFIKYSEEISESVEVLDKLDRRIVAGDVIYFYKDKSEFNINETVRYMTVITEALEGCSYQELIDAAVEINPFTFKFIDSINKNATDYLYSTLPSVTGYYDESSSSVVDVSIYGRNMVNMLNCLGDDTALQTGIMSNDNNILDMLRLQTTADSGLNVESQHTPGGSKHDVYVNIDVGSAKMLKITNAYFRNTNVGNLESSGLMTPSNMVLDERQIIHSASIDDYNPDDKTFRFTKTQFFDSDVKNWRVGAICVTYDQRTGMIPSTAVPMQSMLSNTKTYIWDEKSEDMSFTLTDDFSQYTSHIITMWASLDGGFRHYSDRLVAKYDTSEAAYVLGSFSEIQELVEPDKAIFDISSISASKQNDVKIQILIPDDEADSDYTVFVNTNRVQYGVSQYSDSWSTVEETSESEECIVDNKKYRKITLKATMTANLPTAYGQFDNVADYNASPGEDNGVNGCTFFQNLIAGRNVSTDSRSLNIAVNYTYSNKRHVGYKKVTQPGYVDTRTIPNVTIDLKKDLKSLEESNRSDLGVMANQFQFFVEVGIDGFDRKSWGSFVDEKDITLNMVIRNAEVDYENVQKYGIQLVQQTKTLHVNTTDKTEDFNNNYVRFHTYIADPSNGSMFNKTQKELDRMDAEAKKSASFVANDTVGCTSGKTLSVIAKCDDDVYYEMKSDYFGESADTRPEGMQDNIEVTLSGITFSKVSEGKFRFRVVTEMGNPLFSMLFFRFYVADMWIQYGQNTFHVGTGNLASKNIVGNQTTYNYMFSSDTLRAWLCPVSLTSIPKELDDLNIKEGQYVDPTKAYMTGSDLQLSTKTSFYVPKSVVNDNEHLTDSEKTSKYVKEQSMGWFDFSVKKKYFQDNIMSMQIRPLFPSVDFQNSLSYAEVMNMEYTNSRWRRPSDTEDDKFDEIQSNRNENNYMSVIYHATVLGAQKRQDVDSFYYNSVLYNATKYSQKLNRTPVMTEQNVSCEVRDTSLYNAVQTWNKWFQDSPHTGEHLFRGNLASYGNGYVYLTEKDDENLTNVAKDKDVYTPIDTQLLSDVKIPYEYYQTCEQPTTINSAPEQKAWFRTLLYQTGWQYPKYYTEDRTQKRLVDLYSLTPNGKYLDDVKNHTGNDYLYEVPYNIMYSLYPRCAYDSDNDTAICFMLRCPTVVKENKYVTESNDLKFIHIGYQPLDSSNLFPAD